MILQDRLVLVTGGAKRIGQAIALTLARRGARLLITYRRSAVEARQTIQRLERLGGRAEAVRVELSEAAQVRRLFEALRRRYGRLDALINCAATFERVPFARLTEAHWDRALDVNLKGAFLCSLYASRLMRRGGKIVNLADWAGVRPYRHYLPYCVSKAGVIGLTKALALELAPAIQVVAVAPGPVLPPPGLSASARARIARRLPLRRWGSPQDVANTVRFLLEDTDFMTGSVVYVDGGQLIAPPVGGP